MSHGDGVSGPHNNNCIYFMMPMMAYGSLERRGKTNRALPGGENRS